MVKIDLRYDKKLILKITLIVQCEKSPIQLKTASLEKM